MTSFTIMLLCLQACLIQAVFGSCGCGMRALPRPTAAYECGKAAKPEGMYSSGLGEVNVFGNLPMTGNTMVAGSVPVLGKLSFGGPVPAAGAVSMSGSCVYPQASPAAQRGAMGAAYAPRWYKPACGCY